jgi:hypothetical protein
MLARMLAYNDVNNVKIWEAKDIGFRMSAVPGPFDLIYSFWAIGFHWSLNHFIDDILSLMRPGSYGIFTVNKLFVPPPQLVAECDFHIATVPRVWPENTFVRLLVMKKT